MKEDSRKGASEKPVVIVRRKAGKGSAPTGPTEAKTRQALPVENKEVSADPPQPPPEPQQLEASTQPQTIDEAVLSKKAERKRLRGETLEILRTRWPQPFPRDFRHIRP